MMIRRTKLLIDQTGQDLVEYVLILAFVALAGAALYVGMNQSMRGLWVGMNGRLTNASN